MPVFKAFFAIAKKRRNAALIYLGIYAVITLLLSALSQDSINENFKASQRSIAITDEDNTDASRALCNYLASIHQVTTPEPGEDTALLDAIYYRTLNYAMVIPEGFEDRVLAGETKDLVSSLTIPGSSSSQYVDNQITQYVQALQLYLAGGDTIAGGHRPYGSYHFRPSQRSPSHLFRCPTPTPTARFFISSSIFRISFWQSCSPAWLRFWLP